MIKDVVVHLTGSDEDNVRLAYAEPIARMFDAHLTGLQVHTLPELVLAATSGAGALLDQLMSESYEAAGKVTDTLSAKFAAFDVPNDLRRLDLYPPMVGPELAAETRTADLFIGTRPYGDPSGEVGAEEGVLFQSGRGCLFVPPNGIPPKRYAKILIAWKNTRESARAVAEALPFLEQASEVVVSIVEEKGASEQVEVEEGADIGRYLSRHGISAEIRKIGGWIDPAEALSSEAIQLGANLIVMGGYGHSRFREWVLGGVTRQLLASSMIPILMAH